MLPVSPLPQELDRRILDLASDREAGASEILETVIALLRDAPRMGAPVLPVARAICRAQPTMACVWNAAIEAVLDAKPSGRFERFAERVARSQRALTRFAIECFRTDGANVPLRVATLSYSRSVLVAIEAISRQRSVHVSCSEGRPALEGRRAATRLAELDIPVRFFADAAIGHALTEVEVVIVGADAVTPRYFLNKSGTRMLAAAAAGQGVPLYVIAARDKFVSDALAAHLTIREGDPAEIWDVPPAGVSVRNPYFEPTPLDLVTGVISDVGVLGADMVRDVCESLDSPAHRAALDELTRSQ